MCESMSGFFTPCVSSALVIEWVSINAADQSNSDNLKQ